MNMQIKETEKNTYKIYDKSDEDNYLIQCDYDKGITEIYMGISGLDDYYNVISLVKNNPDFKNPIVEGVTDMQLSFNVQNEVIKICYAELLDGAIFIQIDRKMVLNFEEKINLYREIALMINKKCKEIGQKGNTL